MEIIESVPSTEDRLPWRKPEIHRLNVALDTQSLFGSGPDAAAHTTD
jgi:hypothetical protein